MRTQGYLVKFIDRLRQAKTIVLGDIMADKYVYGKVSRISPEAPVPVVEVVKETIVPGGAGNVASNIASLGGKIFLVGVVGEDAPGKALIDDLTKRGVNTDGIFYDGVRPTTLKTRIIAHQQQVVRCDWENKINLSPLLNEKIINYLKRTIPNVNAVVISDYGKGVISPFLLKRAIFLSHRYHRPVVVDPKVEHFLRYRRVTCITPNLSEAMGGMHWHRIDSEKNLENLGEKILKKLNCASVLITRGEQGMILFEISHKMKSNTRITRIPTSAREVYDVTGAGDTVVSVLSLGLASGMDIRSAAWLANYAAGIVIGKLGTATVLPKELRAAVLRGT